METYRELTDRIFVVSWYEKWVEDTENSTIFKLFVSKLDEYLKNEYENVIFKLDPYMDHYCYEVCLTNKEHLSYSYRVGYIYPTATTISSTCFLRDSENGVEAKDEKSMDKLIKQSFKRKQARETLLQLNSSE